MLKRRLGCFPRCMLDYIYVGSVHWSFIFKLDSVRLVFRDTLSRWRKRLGFLLLIRGVPGSRAGSLCVLVVAARVAAIDAVLVAALAAVLVAVFLAVLVAVEVAAGFLGPGLTTGWRIILSCHLSNIQTFKWRIPENSPQKWVKLLQENQSTFNEIFKARVQMQKTKRWSKGIGNDELLYA